MITPVDASAVAIVLSSELQIPPEVMLVNVVVAPTQIEPVPPIGAGVAGTVLTEKLVVCEVEPQPFVTV